MPERGVNIRMPSTALLGVSSADRYPNNTERRNNPTTPYDILLTSRQNYLSGFFTRIALTEVRLPWYMQTITERNRTIVLRYRVGGIDPIVPFTVRINPGWYTLTTLGAELQRAIRASVVNGGANKPSFTVAYNPATYVYEAVANVGADTFEFAPSTQTTTGLYEMMGWTQLGFVLGMASGIPTLLSTEFVDIVSSNLTYAQDVKDGDTDKARDVVARIYLAKDGVDTDPSSLGSQPFTIYRQFATPKQIKWDNDLPIGQLSFQMYDDKGNILSSLNPTATLYDTTLGNWSITLLVSEV
jgi:hypothetical protein